MTSTAHWPAPAFRALTGLSATGNHLYNVPFVRTLHLSLRSLCSGRIKTLQPPYHVALQDLAHTSLGERGIRDLHYELRARRPSILGAASGDHVALCNSDRRVHTIGILCERRILQRRSNADLELRCELSGEPVVHARRIWRRRIPRPVL